MYDLSDKGQYVNMLLWVFASVFIKNIGYPNHNKKLWEKGVITKETGTYNLSGAEWGGRQGTMMNEAYLAMQVLLGNTFQYRCFY